MLAYPEWLGHLAEVVKIVGGLASFYAVWKLREIEKKYLFKATIPELAESIQQALDDLNLCLPEPSQHKVQISELLNCLIVDVRNIKRKARGDTFKACLEMLDLIAATRPPRYFWQAQSPMAFRRGPLLEIYGKGHGLIRALKNDMKDYGWSGK